MKKFTALIVLLSVSIFAFAQTNVNAYVDPMEEIDSHRVIDSLKVQSEIVVPEDQHLEDKNAKIYFEYMPLYKELRVYYDTWMTTYDVAEATDTVIACVTDFLYAKEYTVNGEKKVKEQYSHYDYLRPSREKYYKDDKGLRRAQFVAYIKISR